MCIPGNFIFWPKICYRLTKSTSPSIKTSASWQSSYYAPNHPQNPSLSSLPPSLRPLHDVYYLCSPWNRVGGWYIVRTKWKNIEHHPVHHPIHHRWCTNINAFLGTPRIRFISASRNDYAANTPPSIQRRTRRYPHPTLSPMQNTSCLFWTTNCIRHPPGSSFAVYSKNPLALPHLRRGPHAIRIFLAFNADILVGLSLDYIGIWWMGIILYATNIGR